MPTKTTDRAVLIGARIAKARDDAQLSTSALAREAGLERNQLKRLIRGANEPRMSTLERIAKATGKPIGFFQPEQPARSVSIDAAIDSLVDVLADRLRSRIAETEDELVEELVS